MNYLLQIGPSLLKCDHKFLHRFVISDIRRGLCIFSIKKRLSAYPAYLQQLPQGMSTPQHVRESVCSIDICLAGRNDAYGPLSSPRVPCTPALSLRPSTVLHCCHLARQHLHANTVFIPTSRTAHSLYLGEWGVNIISTVTHLTAFTGFKAHWSLAAFKYRAAFNVGGGEIIRLTKMNNWCVCCYTRRASFFIVSVDC